MPLDIIWEDEAAALRVTPNSGAGGCTRATTGPRAIFPTAA